MPSKWPRPTAPSCYSCTCWHRLKREAQLLPHLAQTFAATRLKTHVTRFRPLLADRIAPNKLWRRSFWDGHALRFPEGVVHEEIAQAAKSKKADLIVIGTHGRTGLAEFFLGSVASRVAAVAPCPVMTVRGK